ncbi:MAG: hypothetical protein AB7T06_23765 [Kofleriaceae bacterium]
MTLRLVGLVLVVGCASPTPSITPSSPSPLEVTASPPAATMISQAVDVAPMFALPELPPLATTCRTFPLPTGGSRGVIGGARTVVYDFAELPLGRVERGPRASQRERRVDPLTTNELLVPFARRNIHITQCWKWFAATHPGGDTELDVRLTFDVFGATSGIYIANKPADADLAACVRDGFAAPLYVYAPRNHERQTAVTIELVRADQPPWKKQPRRPAAITSEPLPERGSTCLATTSRRLDARVHRLRVSDFELSREPPPAPLPGGMRRRAIQIPQVRIGCVHVTQGPDKAALRAAVQSNWGAYEACHADARTRMPDLAGTIHATLTFGANGAEPTLATVSGAGDAELHACLDRALEEVWLDPPSIGLVIANFTFPLVLDEPPLVRDEAAWRAELARPLSALDGCRARHELVEDRLRAIPWIDDARVRAAFAELARYIAAQSPADAKACLAEVDATLRRYSGVDGSTLSHAADGLEARLDRLETLRPLIPIAEWGPNLMWMIALAYRKDPARFDEGTHMLEQLAQNPMFNDVVEIVEPVTGLQSGCVR